MKRKFGDLLLLFISFFKVGLFTFGGGYAMIPIIQREVSDKRKWLTSNEILDILAISEATPGPIAVNTSTYVGYKVAGFWGAVAACVGTVLPALLSIVLIVSLLAGFESNRIVKMIFVVVTPFILSTGVYNINKGYADFKQITILNH